MEYFRKKFLKQYHLLNHNKFQTFLTLFNKRKDNVPTYSINKEDFTNFTITNITKVPLSYEIKENNNSYRGSKDFSTN